MTTFDRVLARLLQDGLLLEVDNQLPSLAALIAGEPIRGSWWSHPRARAIYAVAERLVDHPDVTVAKLISGKVTFVHRALWPAISGAGRAREKWQVSGLSAQARALLRRVERQGEVRTDTIPREGHPGDAAVELERRLLVASEQVHTERGAHARRLRSWERWATAVDLPGPVLAPAEARGALESAVEALNRKHAGAGRLPWIVATLVALLLPAAVRAAEPLRTTMIRAAEDESELEVRVRAAAPGASWQSVGRECAVLRVTLDGRYDQHLFLVGGPVERVYSFLVGPLPRGEHALAFEWDRRWGPELLSAPLLDAVETSPLHRGDPAVEPVLRAPIVHIRPDTVGRASDVPLLVYWERESTGRVAYTVVFSNEDGGTNTERLMARWGRTTDIEWCYAYTRARGGITDEYQARNHKVLPFEGRREGLHPVLYDTTLNNIFADVAPSGASDVRVRPTPVFVNLAGRAREVVMDRFPWTYALMAEEMIREKKVSDPPHAGGQIISDLRRYAYLEVCSAQRGTELFFELQLRGNARWYSSDNGDPLARIDRSGCVRSTVELPAGTLLEEIRALRVQCRPAANRPGEPPVSLPETRVASLERLFMLDDRYQPRPDLGRREVGKRLKPGDSVTVEIR